MQFCGRTKILKDLEAQHQCILKKDYDGSPYHYCQSNEVRLIGPHRIGKTSICKKFTENVKNNIYINLQDLSISSPKKSSASMVQGIGNHILECFPEVYNFQEDRVSLRALIQRAVEARLDATFVVVVDEIETAKNVLGESDFLLFRRYLIGSFEPFQGMLIMIERTDWAKRDRELMEDSWFAISSNDVF
ncbi:MAG: hypothetical protein AAF797_03580 [Planctomycetota bacterium]